MITLYLRDRSGETTESKKLGFGTWTLGRDKENDIVLQDSHISRVLGKLTLDANGIWLENVSRDNVIGVGESDVTSGQKMALTLPVELNIYPYQLSIIFEENATAEFPVSEVPLQLPTEENEEKNIPQGTRIVERELTAVLTILSGNAETEEFVLSNKESFLIGRGAECDVQIKDFKMSRIHAVLSLRNQNFSLSDQNTPNGTFVNGEKIFSETPLPSGSIFQTGDTVFQFAWIDFSLKREKSLEPRSLAPAPVAEAALPPALSHSLPPTPFSLPSKGNRMRKLALLPVAILVLGLGIYQVRKPENPTLKQEKVVLNDRERETAQIAFNQALHYYQAKDFVSAMREAAKLLQLAPDHQEARELYAAAEQALTTNELHLEELKHEREAKELADQAEFYYSLAMEHLAKDSFESARENFEKVLEISPTHEGAQTQFNLLQAKFNADKEPAPLPVLVQTPDFEEDQKWAKTKLQAAEKAFEEEDLKLAISLWKEILNTKAKRVRKPLLRQAEEGLSRARARVQERYQADLVQAEVLIGENEFTKAKELLEPILREDPTNPTVKRLKVTLIGKLRLEAKQRYVEALIDRNVGDIETAKKKLEQIVSLAPKDDLYYRRAQEKLRTFR